MRTFIRNRRKRKRIQTDTELQLTSLLDILVIILVFLLKTYSTSTNNFTTLPGMKLPLSSSEQSPPDSLHIIITPEAMTFENERVLSFETSAEDLDSDQVSYRFQPKDLDEQGRKIVPLFDALLKAKEKSEILRAKSQARDTQGQPLKFEGVLAIQADKRIRYDVIRKVMYTAAAADYQVFRFLALKK